MTFVQEALDSLRKFDTARLNDLEQVGSWPIAVKAIVWAVAFAGILALGYLVHVTGLIQTLEQTRREEQQLRQSFEEKWYAAANLDAYRQQQLDMEESLGALLHQLPGDTEIPGLIEDITLVGLNNGLAFESIALQPEVAHEFYIEKPIRISVQGGYHNLGAFVSDVADLSRIVTLHEFSITPVDGGRQHADPHRLRMDITAKTYRYSDP